MTEREARELIQAHEYAMRSYFYDSRSQESNPFDEVAAEIDTDMGRKEYIAHMLTELQTPSRALSVREEDFLDSVGGQFYSRGNLSDKQFNWLQSIYKEKGE